MDLAKSRISGHLFLYPVPHLPAYTSIRLHISRGFSSGCKVYIRPGEDVAVTGISLGAAPTGPSPTHRTGPTQTKPSGSNWCSGDNQSWPSFAEWPPLQFHAMDTATQVTLLVLVVAAAGIGQALHIQGSPDRDDILLGSEQNMPDTLLGLVRRKYFKFCSNSPSFWC